MKITAKILSLCLVLALAAGFMPAAGAEQTEDIHTIVLSSKENDGSYTHGATLDGQAVPEYDYTWHADPSADHDQVKNSPAEYFTGTQPGDEAVYIAHDIYYYPMLDQNKFQLVHYDGEQEWVYMYEAEGYENYIFSTLPSLRTGFPSHMMHTEEDAYSNAVLHITQPGTYVLEGQWHGQVRIDLGDDAFDDPTQKVTLILNGVQIDCTVAPGVVFANVYECDNAWEDADGYSHKVDTTQAGAQVIIADGTTNQVSGANIFRILRTKYKDDDSTDAYPAQKKQLKLDGAFYSYQSMNITGGEAGTGVLNIISQWEGLNSELHLTINGGNLNIYSQDDGINVNEDGVSVLTVNGGNLHICAGLGAEGDGIDSNGFLVINGGTVITSANPAADSGLDSDCGSFVNGGTVVALGSAMDWAEADDTVSSTQPVLNMRFAGAQNADEAIVITDLQDKVVFAYDPDKDEVTGDHQRTYSGAIISAPGLQIGGSYRIYVGGNVTGTEVSGVYDVSTVTAFAGGTLQCYSGNALGGPGGLGGQGQPGQRPEMPEGQQPGQGMTPPDGQMPGQGMNPGQPGGQMGNGATCAYENQFTLSQQINAFSSVTDFAHRLVKVEQQETMQEHYACSGCGGLFADAQGLQPVTAEDLAISGRNNTLLIVAGTLLAVCVAVVALLMRRKKKAK